MPPAMTKVTFDDDYTTTPTYIRIFEDEMRGWCIDGAESPTKFTEACWTHWDNKKLTHVEAVRRAADFMEDHGWEDVPIIDFGVSAQIVRARHEAAQLLED